MLACLSLSVPRGSRLVDVYVCLFQGLTDEQKVVLIRRELPQVSAEEAMNALEVTGGNVDAAIASMAQVCTDMAPGYYSAFHT